jgi:hypothetical protein
MIDGKRTHMHDFNKMCACSFPLARRPLLYNGLISRTENEGGQEQCKGPSAETD